MRDQVEKTKSGSPSPSMSPAAIALATSVSSAVLAFSGTAAANGLSSGSAGTAAGVDVQQVADTGFVRGCVRGGCDEIEIAVAFHVDEQHAARVRLGSHCVESNRGPESHVVGRGRRVEIQVVRLIRRGHDRVRRWSRC